METKSESLREAYGNELVSLGKRDPNVVVLDADLSSSTRTGIFGKEFPERFFNMGISEQSMVTAAAGLALSGKKVFASTFAVFLMRTYEQIRQSVCYNNLDVKFVTTHAGITVGEDGATHQIIKNFQQSANTHDMLSNLFSSLKTDSALLTISGTPK